ncbi:hypothetical protein MBAV_005005 [Candidatus Magnetobacterium bavaricum]|uniref:Uncharacterized protein n=1 Tax=Candidatus Magnetobacterium bavaricum TaxID=29290 RepID=A0A0F3GLM8_9BACT|nr:hypothetical protein MBAV_005005 [Candidatus Magnetobacterium bavaricum]
MCKVVGWAVAEQSLVEAHDVAHLLGDDPYVVGDKEDRDAKLTVEMFEKAIKALLRDDVNAHSRFIEDEHVRFSGKCAGDKDPLAFSTGERTDNALAVTVHFGDHHGPLDGVAVGLFESPKQAHSGRASAGRYFVDGGGEVVSLLGCSLGDVADPKPLIKGLPGLPKEPDLSAGRPEQPEDELQQRGLTAAIGAYDAEVVPPSHV